MSTPPRFLCDRMLERLGRYLRAAGYDTTMAAPDASDEALARRAAGCRILLTCDRELALRTACNAVLLPAYGLDRAARALAEAVPVDWLHAPFSRCLVDNTPVVAAAPEDRRRLPPRARGIGGAVMLCPACGRLYWQGSHVRRMLARLERWQDGAEEA